MAGRKRRDQAGDGDGNDEEARSRPAPPPSPASRARARDSGAQPIAAAKIPPAITRTLERIDEAEDLLASGVSRQRTASMVAQRWGIGRRQAQDYVRYVYDRWRNEGAAEDREEKRMRMRAMIEHTYAAAMKHRKAITVGDGEGAQHVEMFDDPDFGSATKLLELACRFDGLLEQPSLVEGGFDQTLLVQLHQHYYGVAPASEDVDAIDAHGETVPALESGDDK